jgi:hypothetical protein
VFIFIIVILICVIYYWVRAKAQSVRKLVDLEVERLRIERVPVRTVSHREYAAIVNRVDRGVSQHDIETMAHFLRQQARERALNDPQTVMLAHWMQSKVNEQMVQQGGSPMIDAALEAAAKRHASDIGKQLIANLERGQHRL